MPGRGSKMWNSKGYKISKTEGWDVEHLKTSQWALETWLPFYVKYP